MVYEGEQEGPYIEVMNLISKTIKSLFNDIFPVVNNKIKDKKKDNPYKKIQNWFEKNKLKLKNDISNKEYRNSLHEINGLNEIVKNNLKSFKNNPNPFIL